MRLPVLLYAVEASATMALEPRPVNQFVHLSWQVILGGGPAIGV